MKKILLIRFSSLGDIVLLSPAFAKLKQEYKNEDTEIVFLTHARFASLLQNDPSIDKVLAFPEQARKSRRAEKEFFKNLIKENFSLVLDMHGSMRSRLLCRRLAKGGSKTFQVKKYYWQRYFLVRWHKKITSHWPSARDKYNEVLEQAAFKSPWGESRLYTTKDDQKKAEELFPAHWNFNKTVAVAPAAAWPLKQWPPQYFFELITRLLENKYYVVILGARGESQCDTIYEQVLSYQKDIQKNKGLASVNLLNLRGQTSVLQVACILEKSLLLVGNDSSHIHIAEAMQTTALALMGPTSPILGFAPYRAESRVAQENSFACRPCTRTGKGKCCYQKGEALCLQKLSVEKVWDIVTEILA